MMPATVFLPSTAPHHHPPFQTPASESTHSSLPLSSFLPRSCDLGLLGPSDHRSQGRRPRRHPTRTIAPSPGRFRLRPRTHHIRNEGRLKKPRDNDLRLLRLFHARLSHVPDRRPLPAARAASTAVEQRKIAAEPPGCAGHESGSGPGCAQGSAAGEKRPAVPAAASAASAGGGAGSDLEHAGRFVPYFFVDLTPLSQGICILNIRCFVAATYFNDKKQKTHITNKNQPTFIVAHATRVFPRLPRPLCLRPRRAPAPHSRLPRGTPCRRPRPRPRPPPPHLELIVARTCLGSCHGVHP